MWLPGWRLGLRALGCRVGFGDLQQGLLYFRNECQNLSGEVFTARMGPPGLEWVWFLLEGAKSNLWGYRCPVYCVQPDGALLLLTFLVGVLVGAGLVFSFLRPLTLGPPPSQPLTRPSSSASSRRLALYGQRG